MIWIISLVVSNALADHVCSVFRGIFRFQSATPNLEV